MLDASYLTIVAWRHFHPFQCRCQCVTWHFLDHTLIYVSAIVSYLKFCYEILNSPGNDCVNMLLHISCYLYSMTIQYLIQLTGHVIINICCFIMLILCVSALTGILQSVHLQRSTFTINTLEMCIYKVKISCCQLKWCLKYIKCTLIIDILHFEIILYLVVGN
jgi:flagellar biosynthesis protein FlhB